MIYRTIWRYLPIVFIFKTYLSHASEKDTKKEPRTISQMAYDGFGEGMKIFCKESLKAAGPDIEKLTIKFLDKYGEKILDAFWDGTCYIAYNAKKGIISLWKKGTNPDTAEPIEEEYILGERKVIKILGDPDQLRLEIEQHLGKKGYKKHRQHYSLFGYLPLENFIDYRRAYVYKKGKNSLYFKWQEIDWGETNENGDKENEKGFTYLKKPRKVKVEADKESQFQYIGEHLLKKGYRGLSNLLNSLTKDPDSRLLINQKFDTIRFIIQQTEDKFDWCFDIVKAGGDFLPNEGWEPKAEIINVVPPAAGSTNSIL